jgi:hypothetical protein
MHSRLFLAIVLAGSMTLTMSAQDAPPKPPTGWSEYIPGTKAFGVWLPDGGRRSERTRDMTFGGSRLKISLVQVEKDRTIYRAEQVSLPVKPGVKIDPTTALEAFRDAFVKDVDGLVTADSDIKLGKMAGKEYVMDAGKTNRAKLRIYVTGPRVYMISMIGPKAQVEGENAKLFFDSYKHQGMVKDELAAKDPKDPKDPKSPKEPKELTTTGPPMAVTPTVSRGPRTVGGGFDKEFMDRGPEGSYLVGFEVGLGKFINNDIVKAAKPIYRSGNKDTAGEQFGTDLSNVVKVVAKPGYVVGSISVKTGLGVDGFSITFSKLGADGKLDLKDSYESEWVGGKGGGPPVKLGGDGTPAVGFLCKKNVRDVTGLGLIYFGERGMPTQILGGAFDPEFKDIAPGKGLLVGLEVGLGKFINNDVVRAVRPIYREDGKDALGGQRGTDLSRVQKVVAKPGYAVGAVSVKAGLGVDGFSITFMKLGGDGKLDPKDSYESEWVGGMGGGGPVKLGGDGTPIIGITGKSNKKDMTGFGLLLEEPKKK